LFKPEVLRDRGRTITVSSTVPCFLIQLTRVVKGSKLKKVRLRLKSEMGSSGSIASGIIDVSEEASEGFEVEILKKKMFR